MLTAGNVRELIEGMGDDQPIPIYVAYNHVCDKYVFVRVDDVTTDPPAHALINADDRPGLCLCLSLVDEDDMEEGDDEGDEEEEGDE